MTERVSISCFDITVVLESDKGSISVLTERALLTFDILYMKKNRESK